MHAIHSLAAAASLALLAATVSAHPNAPRSGGTRTLRLNKRATEPTDWTSAATITGTAQECSPYNVPEVNSIASSYPAIWEIASIPPSDTYASGLFAAMQTGMPNISPRGTSDGDFSGVKYDGNTDPDCWWTDTLCTTPKLPGIPPDVTHCPEPETYGLSFDDGPNCTHNAFYDYLKDNNQKATMCYIGSNVMDWPLQAQRGIADGHHIIGHTWSHRYMTALTNEQVFAELYYSSKAIKDVMGISVDAWRPPYGDVDDRVRYIATQLGLKTILWSEDTDDWEVEPSGDMTVAQIEANYQKIIANVSSTTGNIVLAHEIDAQTMELFMDEYDQIKAAFKHITPLSACMNWTNPYPEGIVFPNFEEYASGTTMPVGAPTTFAIAAASYSPYEGGGSSAAANGGFATSSSQTGKSTATGGSNNSNSNNSTSAASPAIAKSLAGIAAAVVGGAVLIFLA